MSTTTLLIERDTAWVHLVQPMMATCTVEEWNHPAHRLAAIERAWRVGVANIRSEDLEFVCPHPVVLYFHPTSGDLVAADIRQRDDLPHRFINPRTGRPTVLPGADIHKRIRTTYGSWAEGPFPHLDVESVRANPNPMDDIEVQRIRAQNSALRTAIDAAFTDADYAPFLAQRYEPGDLVDFRIRGVFRRRELRVLESRQTGEDAKLITSEGVVELDKDEAA